MVTVLPGSIDQFVSLLESGLFRVRLYKAFSAYIYAMVVFKHSDWFKNLNNQSEYVA